MRIFKIIVTVILLLVLAGLALMGIKQLIPSAFGPSEDEIAEIHHNDDNVEGDDIYSQTLKQYEGTVKPLGVSIYQEGTHRLESEDTLVALLESTKVNLPDFEEKEVKIRGYIRDTVEGGQKIMDVRFIEQLKEAGVKGFNEVGYEWSFSYPADWKTEKEKDKVSFIEEKGDSSEKIIIVYQYPNLEDDLVTWLADRDQNLFFESTQVKVGNSTGVRRTITNGDQQIIKTYTISGDTGYEIRLLSQDEVIKNQYFSIIDFFQTSFVDESGEDELEDDEELEELGEEDLSTSVEMEKGEDEDDLSTTVELEKEEEDLPTMVEMEKEEEEDLSASVEMENEEGSSEESLTTLEALSSAQVSAVVEKGYSPFSGRNLSFSYPKAWYFAYLEGGNYGFTDGESYSSGEDEVTLDNSRIMILAGKQDISCVDTAKKSIEDTEYTVCAREDGLEAVISDIAKSISAPTETE
jgi:hypothetical protein